MVRRFSLLYGLLIGIMWMGEVLVGNLGDTPVLGNLRTFHFHLYGFLCWSFIGGALAFTMFSGFYTAYRTGNAPVARKVAHWSGLISGAITFVTLLGMTALFLDALQHSRSDLNEFARDGDASFTHFLFMDALGGGLNHLWIGPALGIVLGFPAAAAGSAFHRKLTGT